MESLIVFAAGVVVGWLLRRPVSAPRLPPSGGVPPAPSQLSLEIPEPGLRIHLCGTVTPADVWRLVQTGVQLQQAVESGALRADGETPWRTLWEMGKE